jgi:hypothetical protein
LLTRLNKAAAKTEKESTMDASEIMKRHPSELHPGMSADKAFAELYKNTDVWQACAIAKSSSWFDAAPVFNPVPHAVTGTGAQDVNDATAAMEALHRIGRERWPEASEAQQFARAFESRPDLAAKAHRRPSAV